MKTSIVILTHNQLAMTVCCLESIRKHTPQDYEIIVVDNGSTDGTTGYLKTQPDIILHENSENLGFAKGCNQGVELSSGDQILFLNNDTIVTEHWLENMLQALYSSDRVGMTGPVTNNSSGHQKIAVSYTNLTELDSFSERYCRENKGRRMEVRRLIGFCLLAKRSMLDEIGGFDERFGLGNYEDDDLCLRAIRQGYSLLVAQDSYIHHFGHATMNILKDVNLGTLLAENRQKASDKWGDNIHHLIYKQPMTVSLCMIVKNAGHLIQSSLASVADIVDEIIIVDCGSTDQTIGLADPYTSDIYEFFGDDDDAAAYRFAFDMATQDFVLWLEAGDTLAAEEQRKFTGLKLSIDDEVETITLIRHINFKETAEIQDHEEQTRYRFMTRKKSGFQRLKELADNPDSGRYRIDSGIQVRSVEQQ